MSTSIHIPEGLLSFHIGHSDYGSQRQPKTIFLKRVVADLKKWLSCSWAAGLIPSRSAQGLVPELDVVCVEGDSWRREVPDLICPIRNGHNSGVAAIVALGPRNDGTPYSAEDRKFADALCGHIGDLLENDRLARNVSDDLIAAERTTHDSAVARGLYERLDYCPAQVIAGAEFGGQCQRASPDGSSIGGDFFDMIPRGAGELIVAIGNVAASGVPAGIMLGGVLASVRALVSRGETLTQIASELNGTQWELSPEDSFTSFLLARVIPSEKCLRYINAGHEPALILRKRAALVDRLDPTGPVLGLSRKSDYRERIVTFEPGDLFAAFTDGIAESTGPDEVIRMLREDSDAPLPELAAQILESGVAATDRTVALVRSRDAEDRPLPVERYALAAA